MLVCVSHPARWFTGVLREAEQQVENWPAMLQNSLVSNKIIKSEKHSIPWTKSTKLAMININLGYISSSEVLDLNQFSIIILFKQMYCVLKSTFHLFSCWFRRFSVLWAQLWQTQTWVWSFLCSSENKAASASLLCFNTAKASNFTINQTNKSSKTF